MNQNFIKNDTDLFVSGEIGYDFLAEDFIQYLNYFPKDETINVHIYSGGGSLFDALAVYDFVKLKGIKFNAYISGLAGSAATIIGAAAENSYIGANSFYFVHRAFQSGGEMTDQGQALLDNANDRIIKIYQDLTGQTRPTIKKLLDNGDKGAFLTSKEAIQLGFVGSEFKEAQLAASNEWYKDLLNNHINMENTKMEELKSGIVNETVEAVKNFFTKKEKEVSDEALEKTVKDEVSNRVDDVVNTYEDKLKELVENNTKEVESKEAEKVELQNKVDELTKEVEELKGTETKVENNVDKDPTGEEKEPTLQESILNSIISDLNPAEQRLAKKNNK